MEFKEFKDFVSSLRDIPIILGNAKKIITKSESENKKFVRKSIVAQTIKSNNLPPKVLVGMKKYMPMVQLADWEKEDSNYEAHFVLKDNAEVIRTASALFNDTGKLL